MYFHYFFSFTLIISVFSGPSTRQRGICRVLVFPHNEPMWRDAFLLVVFFYLVLFRFHTTKPALTYCEVLATVSLVLCTWYPNNSFKFY